MRAERRAQLLPLTVTVTFVPMLFVRTQASGRGWRWRSRRWCSAPAAKTGNARCRCVPGRRRLTAHPQVRRQCVCASRPRRAPSMFRALGFHMPVSHQATCRVCPVIAASRGPAPPRPAGGSAVPVHQPPQHRGHLCGGRAAVGGCQHAPAAGRRGGKEQHAAEPAGECACAPEGVYC